MIRYIDTTDKISLAAIKNKHYDHINVYYFFIFVFGRISSVGFGENFFDFVYISELFFLHSFGCIS